MATAITPPSFREVFGAVDTSDYLVPVFRNVLVDALGERTMAISMDHLAQRRCEEGLIAIT